jgi:hypothetical protein
LGETAKLRYVTLLNALRGQFEKMIVPFDFFRLAREAVLFAAAAAHAEGSPTA